MVFVGASAPTTVHGLALQLIVSACPATEGIPRAAAPAKHLALRQCVSARLPDGKQGKIKQAAGTDVSTYRTCIYGTDTSTRVRISIVQRLTWGWPSSAFRHEYGQELCITQRRPHAFACVRKCPIRGLVTSPPQNTALPSLFLNVLGRDPGPA